MYINAYLLVISGEISVTGKKEERGARRFSPARQDLRRQVCARGVPAACSCTCSIRSSRGYSVRCSLDVSDTEAGGPYVFSFSFRCGFPE